MMNYLKLPASIFTALTALLIIFSDCNIIPVNNLKTVEVTYIGRDTFQVKAGSKADTFSVQNKVIAKNLDDFLKKAGIKREDIATVRLDSAIATIPQENDLTFDALDEGSLSISGFSALGSPLEKVIVYFPNSLKKKSKVARLVPSVKLAFDVRNLIVKAKSLTLNASLITNRPTPRSDMYLKYSFTIGYQIIE